MGPPGPVGPQGIPGVPGPPSHAVLLGKVRSAFRKLRPNVRMVAVVVVLLLLGLFAAKAHSQQQNFGQTGGLAFVASLPATCTPGVTASVELSVPAYTINYCSATNTWTALGAGGSSAWASLTAGTNTGNAFLIGNGSSLGATGTGTLTATTMPYSGLTSFPAGCTNQAVTAISLSLTCATITSAYTSGTFPATAHNLLSATHGDTVAASPVRGDLLIANLTPAWTKLALGGANLYPKSNGTDLVYSTLAASGVGTPTACSNQFVTSITLSADAAPTSTCTTDTLASAQHANQGTTTTVLHGNAAGNPAFGSVVLSTDVSGQLPIGSVGSSGLSGTSPVTISAAGAIGCATCNTSNATVSSIATTGPITGGTITTTGTIACATCVTSSGGGAESATAPITISAAGLIACATCTTSAAAQTTNAVVIGQGLQVEATIGVDNTTTHALFATAGAPAFRAVVAGDLPNIPLNQVISPTGAISTFADGNNPLIFNCALTSGTTCLTTGETTAATTAGAVEDQITTLATSTAIPLQITQGAGVNATNAPLAVNVAGGTGGANAGVTSPGWKGAGITFTCGNGSNAGATSGTGGAGGDCTIQSGNGGTAAVGSTTGKAGDILLKLGTPGATGTAGQNGTVQVVGSTAGFNYFTQGTTNTTANTDVPATSIIEQAPTAVTAYTMTKPGAAPVIASYKQTDGCAAASCTESFHPVPKLLTVASDFTDSTSTTLGLITGLSTTMPVSQAVVVSFHCALLFDQATAVVSDSFGVGVTGTAPTSLNASGTAFTAAAVEATGTLVGLATTTPTAVVTFTPSVITTVWKAELDGTIEQPSNATPGVFGVYASTTTGTDNLIVKRGSYCSVIYQ
jgi:hypothetical protein